MQQPIDIYLYRLAFKFFHKKINISGLSYSEYALVSSLKLTNQKHCIGERGDGRLSSCAFSPLFIFVREGDLRYKYYFYFFGSLLNASDYINTQVS